jgi:hypothetical protein
MSEEQTIVETTPDPKEPRKRLGRPPNPRPQEDDPDVPSQYVLRAELVAWLRAEAEKPLSAQSNKGLPRAYQSLAAQLEKGVVP